MKIRVQILREVCVAQLVSAMAHLPAGVPVNPSPLTLPPSGSASSAAAPPAACATVTSSSSATTNLVEALLKPILQALIALYEASELNVHSEWE